MPARDDLSRNQTLVLAALTSAPGTALTAYDLLARLATAGLRGPQTVYRALASLQRAGLIHRIESLNAYAACAHDHVHRPGGDHAPHHRPAFAVCRECKTVRELDDAALSAVLGVVAAATGYTVTDRVVELVGACPSCAG